MELQALLGFLAAFTVAALLTPLVARLAIGVGAVDSTPARGLAKERKPLLGGLAMLVAVLAAAALFLPLDGRLRGILAAAAFLAAVGAIDDVYDLPPSWKLAGQTIAALICVLVGVRVTHFSLPLIHQVDLGPFGAPITLLGLVAVINAVNFSDGVDGLTAGVCAIAGIVFAIVAFDLGRGVAAIFAAIIAGAAAGFLLHNFPPASVFMGDCGSNLLGLLLGAVMVEGSLKTNALIALFIPLVILAVPVLDTSFVLAKRLKSRRPVYEADSSHFHHRFHRIGFSQRRTVLHLYCWTAIMACLAMALRFVPYSDRYGHLKLGGSLVMAGCLLIALAASIYLVYVLEILKFRRVRAWQLRRRDRRLTEPEIDFAVRKELDDGDFSHASTTKVPESGSSVD